ncbi:LysR family transcriptional regulator [Citreicella sp. C3M06]|uniref:LysR family transcriptional regulator n=1 Tax=Citreicella sp. C3M06 TaxID=2841564 RepID=UPI001C08CF65|nr:LysR family transcriptional regulator [Citreicella sp. C3M06]MBU2959910.1 LysR family transcriptional regulator [Citreicella sp. C3M06]
MDTRFLESLLAVVDHGSIVAAAQAQALTPAAVSQRIQVLERQLGQGLLDRRANASAPSAAARDLLPAMRRIVSLAHDLQRSADADVVQGVFRLGAISTLLTASVPGLLMDLRRRAPQLELQITPGSSAALYDAVLSEDLHAALIVAPPFPTPFGLQQHALRSEPLRLLVPEDHPARTAEAAFADLPLIAYDPESWGGQIAARYLADRGIMPHVLCALDGLEVISDLVASGIGASLVPDWAGLKGARVLADGAAYQRRLVLLTRTAPDRSAARRLIVDSLISTPPAD